MLSVEASSEQRATQARCSLATGSAVRLSPKQKAVIEHCHICGKITLEAAVELIGRNIYANAGKHVGATLSTMVKRRLLVRIRPGVFVLPNGKAQP